MEKKNWDFDKVIDRKNTQSQKWELHLKKFFGDPELLPLWMADMDFQAPPPVIEAIIHRAKHDIYGYSDFAPSYYRSVIHWFQRRHNWHIKRDWFVFTPGILPALNISVRIFSDPEDKIIIQNPVFPPFFQAIQNNGREILLNQLKFSTPNNRYEMDYVDLREKVKDPSAKILILCSPHNPVGRVWTKKELIELGEICTNNNILVISDEIYCDLVYKNYRHIPFASINENFKQNSIICTSASKTFNLSGLQVSNIIIANKNLRELFKKETERSAFLEPNFFAGIALETAYNKGEKWLESLLNYLKKNLEFLKSFINGNIPQIEVIEPEGTYLVWLDFRNLGLKQRQIIDLIQTKAQVALNHGFWFGKGGKCFERINIACPKSILNKALIRIANAINEMS